MSKTDDPLPSDMNWWTEMNPLNDYELQLLQDVASLTHMPRYVAYCVLFAVAVFTLSSDVPMVYSFITWWILIAIFREGVCISLAKRAIGGILVGVLLGYRWIFGIACAIGIWLRTQPLGWTGWGLMIVVVFIDMLATIFLDGREVAKLQELASKQC